MRETAQEVAARRVGTLCEHGVMDISGLQKEIESISAFYAQRHGIARTDDWFLLKLGEEVGELTQAYLARSGRARDKGRTDGQREQEFASELADVLAHALLIAERFDIDIATEIDRKWLRWKSEMPDASAARPE